VLAQPAGENEKHNADQGATERYQGELNLGAERLGDGLRAGCNPAILPFICCSTLCGEGGSMVHEIQTVIDAIIGGIILVVLVRRRVPQYFSVL
jgi:hypothetical protein